MTDYNITIRIGRSTPVRKGGGRSQSCDWQCAYCDGTGREPFSIGVEKCSACGGPGWWSANVSCDRLRPCGHCSGTGRISNFGFLQKCDVCGGSGKVAI